MVRPGPSIRVDPLKYRTVQLGRDFPGRISDYAKARNSFLNNGWVLFLDEDEEAPRILQDYLTRLTPTMPYYWIRRVNLYHGRYMPAWNPDFKAALVSSQVRFIGRVHERIIPKNPHGLVDIPIIHNHTRDNSLYRNYWYQDLPLYRVWLASKKIVEVARGR